MDNKGVKEDILRALEGKRILLCPHCKNRVFSRKAYSKVEIIEENDCILDDIVGGFEEYEYVCEKCGEEVSVEDMIKTTKLVFNEDG